MELFKLLKWQNWQNMVSIEILRNQGNNFLMLSLLKHSIHQGWYLKQQFFCTGQPECTILAHRVRTEVGYWLLDQRLLQFPLTLLEWMVNFWLLEKCSFTTKYFSCLLGDSELCQKFLKEKQWKIVKKYLVKSVSERKCAPKQTFAFEKPTEHVLKSWSMSQAGIVDLGTSCHKPPKPSQQHKHKFVPVSSEKKSLLRPHTKLKLIFSVILPHPSLNGLLEKAV